MSLRTKTYVHFSRTSWAGGEAVVVTNRTKWRACLSRCSCRRPEDAKRLAQAVSQHKTTTVRGQPHPGRHRNSVCPRLGVSWPHRWWLILTKSHTTSWKQMYAFKIRDITHYMLSLAWRLVSVAASGVGAGGRTNKEETERLPPREKPRAGFWGHFCSFSSSWSEPHTCFLWGKCWVSVLEDKRMRSKYH